MIMHECWKGSEFRKQGRKKCSEIKALSGRPQSKHLFSVLLKVL